jgi:ketosteroid isomerase-like protein
MPVDRISSLRRIYTAVQHRNAEELQEALTHDIEWVLPETLPWGGTRHGHLGVLAYAEIY